MTQIEILRDKRPANVMPARVLPPDVQALELEVWTDTRYVLLAKVRQAVARGEVAEASSWRQVPGTGGRLFSVKVRRLKPATPAWVRWAWRGTGALVGLMIVGAAVLFTLTTLTGLFFLAGGLGVALTALVLKLSGRTITGDSVTVHQTVNIRR